MKKLLGGQEGEASGSLKPPNLADVEGNERMGCTYDCDGFHGTIEMHSYVSGRCCTRSLEVQV